MQLKRLLVWLRSRHKRLIIIQGCEYRSLDNFHREHGKNVDTGGRPAERFRSPRAYLPRSYTVPTCHAHTLWPPATLICAHRPRPYTVPNCHIMGLHATPTYRAHLPHPHNGSICHAHIMCPPVTPIIYSGHPPHPSTTPLTCCCGYVGLSYGRIHSYTTTYATPTCHTPHLVL